LLGIKDGSRIGFWRHFVGEGEKWIVTKAVGAAPLTGCNGVTVPLTSLGVEDVSARHTRFVRVGDAILLQTKKSEHYLSVQDVFAAADPGGSGGSGSVEAIKLIYKERGGLLGAHEALVLEHFGTVPLPAWLTSRPYLSGQMLQVPAKFAQPSSDTEQRVFASSGASSAATTFLSTYRAEKERQQQQAQPDHASAVLSYAEMKKVKPLGQFAVAEQQAMLIRDLLCACMGLNGTYVRALPHSLALQRHTLLPPTVFSPANWGKVADLAVAFLVLPAKEDLSEAAIDVTAQGDRSLLNQVADVLPFCTMLLHLRDFVATQAQYDYGVVSHAFVRALRRLLQEFDVLVCQLEHLHNQRKLTLQKLLFFLQPSRRMMLVLHRVCCGSSAALGSGSSSGATDRGARDLIGGQLLQHLCQQLQAQGDAQAKQLVASLVAETAAPFLQMIAHWIYRGELHDPYHEFMIEEDVSVRKEALQADFNAQYWDHRYTLRPRHIPLALFSMDTAQRILMTGKYLNVVRDCVGDAVLSQAAQDADVFGDDGSDRDAADHDDGDDDADQSLRRDSGDEGDDQTLASLVSSPGGGRGGRSWARGRATSPGKAAAAGGGAGRRSRRTGRRGGRRRGRQTIVLPKAKTLAIDIDALCASYDGTAAAAPRTSALNDDGGDADDGDDLSSVGDDDHDDGPAHKVTESLLTAIEATYRYASQTLLALLERRYGLRSHFHSLGKFFLLEHGDFFIQFMDMAETELRREVSDITLSRLRHLLSMAIQTSTVAQDAHRDALSCSLAPHNLIQHLNLIQMAGELSSATGATAASSSSSSSSSLAGGAKQQQQQFSSMLAQPTQGLKGIEALQLEYSVTWPASIVFSRRAVTKYQLLSRLLYFSKHVERRLLHAWQGQQYTRLLSALARRNTPQSRPLAMILRLSYTLRHRMLHFLQNLVYYMTLEVIHPRVTQLLSDVAQVTDMDRLLEIHEKFIDGCLRECLLASPELLKVLTKLMTTALLFADHMVSLMDTCHRVVSITPISATLLSGAAAAAAAAAAHNNGVITVSTSPLEKKRSFSQKHKDKDDGDSAAQSDANKEDAIALARHRQMQQQRRQRHAMQTETLQQEMSHEACHRVLTKFATTFDSQLKELLDGLWNNAYRQHAQLANLCVRLDYNGFYSSEFAT
jgi:hypothetical protein